MAALADYQLLARLRRIASPIAMQWGAWYPLKVVEEKQIVGGYTDLHEVFVHRHAQLLSDGQLHSILAHEWMHCVEIPRTRARQRHWTEAVAKRVGRRTMWVEPAIALGMELLVDCFNCRVPEWGEAYARETRKLLELGWREQGGESAGMTGLIMACRLLVFGEGLPRELDRYRGTAQAGLDALLRDGVPEMLRTRTISDDAYIDCLTAFCEVLGSRLEGADALAAKTGLELLIERVVKGKRGLRTEVSGTGGGMSDPEQRDRKRSSDGVFDSRLVQQVREVLLWQRRAEPINGRWFEGHPLTQLDMKRSYRLAPDLIPGVTTRRRIAGARVAMATGSERDTRVLIVDDSGSMEGEPARTARSLAEGLNRLSASVQLEVGLLVFASEVVYRIEPGYRYDEIRSVLKTLRGDSGGTRLLPAIRALLDMHHRRPLTHLVIISDAEADDWVQALRPLLPEPSLRISLLLVNEAVPSALRQAVKQQFSNRIRLLQAVPGEVKSTTWIREIAW